MAKGNPYIYAGDKATRAQAAQLAAALAPSAGSVSRPYTRSIHDVGGYTSALASLLGGIQGQVSKGYGGALDTQQQINDAAQARLGGLGDYAAGTQAASGGIGDSAMSRLNLESASAQNYAARQPGIAASRGEGQQASLEQAMSDALAARQEGIRQSAAQLFAQLRDTGLNRQLSYSQFQEGKREFGLNYQQNQDQFDQTMKYNQQGRAQSNKQWRESFIAQHHWDPVTGKPAGPQTPNPKFHKDVQGTLQLMDGLAGGRPNPNYDPHFYILKPDGSRYVDKDHPDGVPNPNYDPQRWLNAPMKDPAELYHKLRNQGVGEAVILRAYIVRWGINSPQYREALRISQGLPAIPPNPGWVNAGTGGPAGPFGNLAGAGQGGGGGGGGSGGSGGGGGTYPWPHTVGH